MVLVGLIPLMTTSCSDEDDEHYLTVNGTNAAEHTFPGMFANGKSGIDYKQVFKIKSDVQWSLNGKVNWLYVSATSGKGEVDLTIYPSSENNSESERKVTLMLSGGDISVSIDIIQEAGKPVCHVSPVNEVALHDRICWEYEATSNVNDFQWFLLSQNSRDRLTEKEILELISAEEKLKYKDGYISFTPYDSEGYGIEENSVYYLVTLAYDIEGIAGELKYTRIETPPYYDGDVDAYVSFYNFEVATFGFSFDVYKEGYCDTYHLIYGGQDEILDPAIYAFQINYYLKHNKKHWFSENWGLEIVTNYPNEHKFTYTSIDMLYRTYCIAYGWGVFKNGELSSDLIGFQNLINEEEYDEEYIVQRSRNNEVSTGAFIIDRSKEEMKANKLRK